MTFLVKTQCSSQKHAYVDGLNVQSQSEIGCDVFHLINHSCHNNHFRLSCSFYTVFLHIILLSIHTFIVRCVIFRVAMDEGGGSRKKQSRPATDTPEKQRSKTPAGSSVASPALARPVRRSISSSFSGKPSAKSPSQWVSCLYLPFAFVPLSLLTALYREYVPDGKSWPSFGSTHAYWEEAAKYVNQYINSPSRFRSGKCLTSTLYRISLYFMESAFMKINFQKSDNEISQNKTPRGK